MNLNIARHTIPQCTLPYSVYKDKCLTCNRKGSYNQAVIIHINFLPNSHNRHHIHLWGCQFLNFRCSNFYIKLVETSRIFHSRAPHKVQISMQFVIGCLSQILKPSIHNIDININFKAYWLVSCVTLAQYYREIAISKSISFKNMVFDRLVARATY